MNAKTLSALVTLFSGIGLCIAGFCVSEAHELNDSLLFYMGECLVYAGAIFNEGCSSFARLESISTNRKNPNYNSRPRWSGSCYISKRLKCLMRYPEKGKSEKSGKWKVEFMYYAAESTCTVCTLPWHCFNG